MRKILAIAVMTLFPFVAQAQQAPQAPSIEVPTMSDSRSGAATVAAVVIGAAVGAVVLPVAMTGIATASAAVAGYSVMMVESGSLAMHTYPYLTGAGIALGAWIGYSM